MRYVALVNIPRETALALARNALKYINETDLVEVYFQDGNWRWRSATIVPPKGCVWTKHGLEQFVESTMKMKLTVRHDGILTYQYANTKGHTMAEVGAPYQQAFRDIIKERNLTVEYGKDVPAPFFVADVVKDHHA